MKCFQLLTISLIAQVIKPVFMLIWSFYFIHSFAIFDIFIVIVGEEYYLQYIDTRS